MQLTVPSLFRAGVVSDVLTSRRGKVTLLLVLVVLTAGCSGASSDVPATEPLDSVPADVDVVAQVDVDPDNETSAAIAEQLNDTAFAMDAENGTDGVRGELMTGLLDENESSLGAESVDSVTMFARLPEMNDTGEVEPGDVYAGMIVDSNASWDEVVAASDGRLDDAEERTEDGVTVYVVDHEESDIWIADFEDGTFAAGTPDAVADVVETRNGDADPFSGDLREAFERADDGTVKVAVELPDDAVQSAQNEAEGASQVPGDLDLPEVQIVTFVADADGENVTMATQLTTESQEAASELAGLFELATGFGEATGDDGGEEMDQQSFMMLLDRVSIEQTDRHVTLRATLTVGEIVDLASEFVGVAPQDGFDTGTGMDSTSTDAGQPSVAGA